MRSPGRTWWKEGIVYQIYPRSFMDSNGDGVGDLAGIASKADYLASLGVDIVWLNPVYRSPNKDNGYDISDYEEVMEEFGTMADLDRLVAALHGRGIRVLMDLVVNHSSDAHPWFVESRSSKDSPKRDWYIWKPGKESGAPNNWKACFTGSAWELDPATGEHYLHLFDPGQPDLNWENPELRRAVYAMMRRWFERGIDGFRMDVVTLFSKDPSYRDLRPGEGMFSPSAPYICGPRLHEFLREMRKEALDGFDAMMVGEAPGATVESALELVGEDRGELDMLFQFELMGIDHVEGDKWRQKPIDLVEMKRVVERWQLGLAGRAWNSNYLMNHDQPRSVSRFGDDGRFRTESAKALLLFNLSLAGTPYIYQGEELGMANAPFASIADCRDVDTLNYHKEALAAGLGEAEAMRSIRYMSRDNARTPMQWSGEANAGFSTGRPWIGVNPDHRRINAEAEEADPDSVLHFTRSMTRFRRERKVLVYGSFELLARADPRLFAFLREGEGERLLVEINFSGEPTAAAALPGDWTILISNLGPSGGPRPAVLAPWGARISAPA
ncbi:MAG: alpha-glucosidase [Spirochaetaceae bacterium]|nr:alpha-glucosidase [Spirochaetaceae bacterium]